VGDNMEISTPPSKRFILLDSLRGYAAFAIMILHFPEINGSFNTYLAVDFFLVLSGFVLMHAYFRDPEFSFWSFSQARFARLYPLHLATLVIFVLIYIVKDSYIDKSALALHGLMLHYVGLGPEKFTFNSPSWSISVEFWVNILVAATMVVGARFLGQIAPRMLNGIILAVSASCYAVLYFTLGHMDGHIQTLAPFVSAGMVRGIASFLAGVLIYKLYTRFHASQSSTFKHALSIATPILLALFAVSLWLPYIQSSIDFLLLPVFFGTVFACAFETGLGSKLVQKISHLGTISFSIYLLHRPIQVTTDMILPATTPLALKMVIVILIVLVAAHFTQKYFEMPVYHWLKKTIRRAQLKLKVYYLHATGNG